MVRLASACTAFACVALGVAGCDDDDDDGKPPSRTPAQVEAFVEDRLEKPGLNALVVESIKCTEDGGDFKCDIKAQSSDSVGDRNGTLTLKRQGSLYEMTGTLGKPGLTSRYAVVTNIPLVRKPPRRPGYAGEVDEGLAELLEAPGPASVKVTSIRCDPPARPEEGEKFDCRIRGLERDEATPLSGTLELTPRDADGQRLKVGGTIGGAGTTIFPKKEPGPVAGRIAFTV